MPLLRTGPTLVLALILSLAGLLVTLAMQSLTGVQQRALDDLSWARHKAEVARTTALLAMQLTHPMPSAGDGPVRRPAAPPERIRQRFETCLLQMAHWPAEGTQARLMAAVQASARRHLDLTRRGSPPAGTFTGLEQALPPAEDLMVSRDLLLDALAALADEQHRQVAQASASAHAAQRSTLGLLLGTAGLLLMLGLGLAWRVTRAAARVPAARPGWAEVGSLWLDPATPKADAAPATEARPAPAEPLAGDRRSKGRPTRANAARGLSAASTDMALQAWALLQAAQPARSPPLSDAGPTSTPPAS